MLGNGVLEASEMPGRRRSIALLPGLAGLFLIAFASQADAYRAYVVNTESASVSVIDTKINQAVGAPIQVEPRPHSITITPDGGTAYMTSGFSLDVSSLDLQLELQLESPISVESEPSEVVVSPDGKTAYVLRGTAERTGVTVLDIWGHRVMASIPSA
jgi:YVTN family beta-propeller protein